MIVAARPPNFDQILQAFPGASGPGVIFSWEDRIFNPSGNPIPGPLVAHEELHGKRHALAGGSLKWWDQYIADPEFRYREELLAHAAEFRAQLVRDRNHGARLLQTTALRLIAPLYNYQPPRTLPQAMRDLRWELER